MSRAQTRPANPAPISHSTNRDPDSRGISPRPYSFIRPFPSLPEQWQSPQAQAKLLNEYLTHDGHFATFAAQRHLSVDQLYDWLNSESIMLARKRLCDMAQERADLLARLARPAAIEALLNLLTKGSINDNQRRLAAGALLRAAASADRRQEKRDQPVPRATGSSGCPCDASATTSPRNHAPSSPAGGGAAVLRGGGGSVSTSSTEPPSHRSAALNSAQLHLPSGPCLLPLPSSPSRILARIGPAASPIPRLSRAKRPRPGATCRGSRAKPSP